MKGDYSFKGSDIDRSFSFGKLHKQLSSTVAQGQTQHIQQEAQSYRSQPSIVENIIDSLGTISHTPLPDLKQEEILLSKKRKKKFKRRGL